MKELEELLTRLGAAFPWETVELCLKRQPHGEYTWSSFLSPDTDKGYEAEYEYASDPKVVVERMLCHADKRDPQRAAAKKIEELKRQIEKLEVFAASRVLPPFRAPGQVGYGEPPEAEPPAPNPDKPIDI